MGDVSEPAVGENSNHRLCIQSQKHGEVCFDLTFNGHRENVLRLRVPNLAAVDAGGFVDSLAAASVSNLAGREFDPANGEDRKAMISLQLELTEEERRLFATRFLETNDDLLCRTESATTVDGHETVDFVPRNDVIWESDPTARLYQAWRIHDEEQDAMAGRMVGIAIDPKFEGMAHAQARGIADAVTGLKSAVESRRRFTMLSDLATARQLGKAYEHPAIRMLADLDATAKRLSIEVGKSELFPALAALGTKAGLLAERYGPGVRQIALGMSRLAEAAAPTMLQVTASAHSLLGRFDPPSWWSRDLATWRGYGVNASPHISLARSAFDIDTAGILNALAEKKLLNDAKLMSQILAPAHAYTTFVSETVRLAGDGPARLRAAYDSALLLGTAHLDGTYGSLGRLVRQQVIPDNSIEEALQQERVKDLLFLQRDELVAQTQARDSESRDTAEVSSLVTDIAVLAASVLRGVPECNDAALFQARQEIFRSTNRVLHAYAKLMTALPTDQATFGEVADDLYFLIYEGGGDDKLRFLKEQGGVFGREDGQVQPVFWLKALRNKWLRHDPDHGDSSGNWKKLRETLQAMGMSRMPNQPDDFKLLYRNLLRGLEAFLSELRDRLQSR